MRSLLFLGLTGLIAASLGSAAIAEDETAESVVDALQGQWMVVGIEAGGHKATPDELEGMWWLIDGNVITGVDPDGSSAKMKFKVNPSQSPKHFDITSLEGKLKGQTDPGIYELKEGRLRVCNGNGKRPKAFTDASIPKGGYGLIILQKRQD